MEIRSESTLSGPADSRTDAELVGLARRSDRGAFDQLLQRHQDTVYNLVSRMMGGSHRTEDVAQEVFLRAFRGLRDFQGQAAFSTWIYRIALNLCSTERARARHPLERRRVSIDLPSERDGGRRACHELADWRPRPEDEIMRAETQTRVRRAIDELEEEFRSVVVLRDLCDFSYEEIAAVIDCPIGTVRSRLHRARLRLEESLRDLVS